MPCEGSYWSVDEIQKFDVNIYPNPVTNNLSIDNNIGLEMNVMLMNIQGKVVYTNEFSGMSSTVDVSNLKAGVYLVQVYTESKNVVVERVVIE